MIYPKQNRLTFWIIDRYVHWLVRRHFRAFNIDDVEVDTNKSVLLIANHFSIWDGLILYYLNQKITGKKFHVMLLDETARREPMLKYGGAFSVNKGSRDIIDAINFSAQLLHDPKNMVLIFPQGKLCSNFTDKITFEKGIMRIMEKAAGNFQLLMAATFVENFKYKKPTVNVYLKTEQHINFENINQLENAYQQHYNAAKARQTQITF